MRAAILHHPEQSPRAGEFSEPVPAEAEVLVHMRAAGLHPVVKALARGTHYGSDGQLPRIPGLDGVGTLDDGTRVYLGPPRPPFGTMAARAAVPRRMCLPLPTALDDVTAAALFNPGLSGWLALVVRARLAPGETVLVLGATGVAGRLAVQAARLLGAGRVIAVGRNPDSLRALPGLGADRVVPIDRIGEALGDLAGTVDVIVDYLWGPPTEAVIRALARKGLDHEARPLRLVSVGESAGAALSLPCEVLRSSGLEICGSGAGTVPLGRIVAELPRFLEHASAGHLRVEAEPVRLSEIERAWTLTSPGRRLVVVPD